MRLKVFALERPPGPTVWWSAPEPGEILGPFESRALALKSLESPERNSGDDA